MGAGWEMYGQAAGYTQAQWNALSQQRRDVVKYNADPARSGANQQIIGGLGGGGWELGGYYPDQTPAYEDPGYGGGYGGGGSGGGYAPPKVLNESPEWLAYLNALGLEEGQYRADADRQRGFMSSDAERQIGDLTPQYDQQRRGIAGSAEGRGVLRSGEYLKRQAESRSAQGRQTSGIQANLAGQLGGVESQLAQKMMDITARKAQQELQLRSQGYQ